MLKKSNYNVKVSTLEDGRILMFNTRTTAFGIMDKDSKRLYDNIETIDPDKLENQTDKQNLAILSRYGFVIPNEYNELDIIKLNIQTGKYLTRSLALTIAPTMDCNMACPYCYETKQKKSMGEDIQELLYDFVKNYIGQHACNTFQVTWYGGEPLLEVDTIFKLSKRFIELSKEKDVKYSSSIITNGVLLEGQLAKRLKEECQISRAQITIDGLPEQHNKRRILVDGRESFDIIMKNVESSKDYMVISIRINCDKSNIDSVNELINHLALDKGWTKNPSFNVAKVRKYNNNCDFKSEDCLGDHEFGMLDLSIVSKYYDHESDDMRRLLYPMVKRNYCGAVMYGCYVVDPDGDLYTCWNHVGDKERNIGNVIQKNPMNAEYMKWLLHEPTGKCLECKTLPICMGGCPYQNINYGEPSCDNSTFNYLEKLKVAYHDYSQRKSTMPSA